MARTANSAKKGAVRIVRSLPKLAVELTDLAFAAKAHWGYPRRWLQLWRSSLTLNAEYVAQNSVYVARRGEQVVGFYAIRPWRNWARLDHLWIRPEAWGQGLGRALFEHAESVCRRRGFKKMRVESDPNAEGFYRRLDGTRVGVSCSRLEGRWRELPVLHFSLVRAD